MIQLKDLPQSTSIKYVMLISNMHELTAFKKSNLHFDCNMEFLDSLIQIRPRYIFWFVNNNSVNITFSDSSFTIHEIAVTLLDFYDYFVESYENRGLGIKRNFKL